MNDTRDLRRRRPPVDSARVKAYRKRVASEAKARGNRACSLLDRWVAEQLERRAV
jgi:hypothetical protein